MSSGLDISGLVSSVQNSTQQLVGQLQTVQGGILSAPSSALSGIESTIGSAIGNIGSAFTAVSTPVLSTIESAVGDVLNGFENNVFNPTVQSLETGLNNVLAQGAAIAGNVASTLAPVINNISDGLETLGTGIINNVVGAAKDTLSALSTVSSNVLGGISTGVADIQGLFDDGLTSLSQFLGTEFSNLQTGFVDLGKGVVDGVTTAFGDIQPFISNIKDALDALPTDFEDIATGLGQSFSAAFAQPPTTPELGTIDIGNFFAALGRTMLG